MGSSLTCKLSIISTPRDLRRSLHLHRFIHNKQSHVEATLLQPTKTPNRRRPARDLCGLVTACGPPSRPKRSLEKKIGVTYLRTRYWFSHGCDGFYLRALQKSHAVFVFQSHFSTPQTEPQKLHRGPRLPLVGPTTLVTAQQNDINSGNRHTNFGDRFINVVASIATLSGVLLFETHSGSSGTSSKHPSSK